MLCYNVKDAEEDKNGPKFAFNLRDTNEIIYKNSEKSTMQQGPIACVMYCVCSMLMTFSNKLILSPSPIGYGFPYPSVILLFQSAFAAFFVYALKLSGLAKFEDLNLKLAIKWFPTNILFVCMLLSGSYALSFLSVPMVTIFKNFTTVIISLGDYFYFDQPLGSGIIASLCLMFFGSVVAALNDLEFRLDGYIWMLINCIISAAYAFYMKIAMKGTKLSEFGSVFYNNLLSLPLISILALIDGFEGISDYSSWTDKGFLMVTVFSGLSSVCISFASFWTVKTTSLTTYSIVGSLNKIPLTIVGVLLFNTTVSYLGGISIVIGLSGGVVFSLYKQRQYSKEAKA